MSFRVENNLRVPMRDGVTLATDAWIPEGAPSPTLVVRLPYGKNVFPGEFSYATLPNIFRLLTAGYAVVWQDCRGTFDSDGSFDPFSQEAADGADTLDWLRDQPWCDGRIGAYGHSYLGLTQWLTVAENPNGLAAIAPSITSTDWYKAPFYSDGGALSWHSAWFWMVLMTMNESQRGGVAENESHQLMAQCSEMLEDPDRFLSRWPLADQPAFAGWNWWSTVLGHPGRDQFWKDVSAEEKLSRNSVPALHIAGWFDPFVANMVRAFSSTRTAQDGVDRSRLIIGPWDHLHFTGVYHDRQFGAASDIAAIDLTSDYLRFFDSTVRGLDDGSLEAPVRLFVMGIDQWRDEDSWPLRDTVYTDYFLSGSGSAGSTLNDGRLTLVTQENPAVDTFVYDPNDPVPSLGGRVLLPASLNQCGPVDQRELEARPDVLCYTSEVLSEQLEVTGHVRVVLSVSSSAEDTDFTGKLVDVFPDGRVIYLTDGLTRMRYRETPEIDSGPLQPGSRYDIEIDLSVTSNVFLPGHRIRLEVSSSNFPRYDRNTNSGGAIAFDSAEQVVVANNSVHLGRESGSRLILPVVTRD